MPVWCCHTSSSCFQSLWQTVFGSKAGANNHWHIIEPPSELCFCKFCWLGQVLYMASACPFAAMTGIIWHHWIQTSLKNCLSSCRRRKWHHCAQHPWDVAISHWHCYSVYLGGYPQALVQTLPLCLQSISYWCWFETCLSFRCDAGPSAATWLWHQIWITVSTCVAACKLNTRLHWASVQDRV